MTKLVLILLLVSTSKCFSVPLNPFFKKNHITARITYYNGIGDGFGNKVACSAKIRAKEGTTVAAHSNFKFFSQIEIPRLKGIVGDGKFIVQDRGSAVQKKKASKGKFYVFDVYLNKKSREFNRFVSRLPEYMTVYY